MIVDPDFCDHWKTRMLVGTLDGDECAPLYVLRLWAHCQNRRQSTFENISSEALKALCRFPGNANKLEASLVTSGFVRRDGKVLEVVGWDEYNSSLIAAWNNGTKGGRPPKFKPRNNTEETQTKPTGIPTGKPLGRNPGVCDKMRLDEIGNNTHTLEVESKNDLAEMPEVFHRSDFQEVWTLWKSHRRQKQKPLASIEEQSQLYELGRFGVDEAIEIVRFTIGRGAMNLILNGDHTKQKQASTVKTFSKQQTKGEQLAAQLQSMKGGT
jgi:hypothetical protein